ncbi:MAG: GGDEF domain-containing protein [Actinoplanes sp.]
MPRSFRLMLVLGVICAMTALFAPAGWREASYLLGAGYALAVVLTGLRVMPGGRHPGWLLLGIGLALRLLGDVTWAWLALTYGTNVALPSAGDVFFFGHYLTMSAGLLLLARQSAASSRVGLIDPVITTTGMLLPAWMFAVEPYLRESATALPAVATAVAYVVCVLLLFASAARLLLVGGYRGRGYTLTAAALVTLVLGDAIYLTEISRTGSTAATGLTYAIWMAAFVLFGAAVRHPLTRRARSVADESLTWQRCVVFVLAAVSAPALWIFHGRDAAVGNNPVVPAVIVAVLSVLLIIRLAIVARLAQRRADELDRRSTALDAALTQQQVLQDELIYRALHDPLTALGNRAMLTEQLEQALRSGAAGTALMLCDLDGFKDVNDTYGHPVGDRVLVEVSRRLQAVAPDGATLARLGGDEFVALVTGSTAGDAIALAHRVVATLAEPYPVDAHLLHVTASVGLFVTDGPATPGAVLRDADLALYAAKNAGKNAAVLFDPAMRAGRLDRNAAVHG